MLEQQVRLQRLRLDAERMLADEAVAREQAELQRQQQRALEIARLQQLVFCFEL